MVVWLTQWLCPRRHCSFAIPWDDKKTNFREIERRGHEIFDSKQANPWCGICGETLKAEHGRTKFKTLKEALPYISEFQKEQLTTRLFLDSLGISKEKLFEDENNGSI